MTQEEKQLLLKDLCARLPYGVTLANGIKARSIDILTKIVSGVGTDKKIEDTKYYLRPMSSMTEEEKKELGNFAAANMFASQNKNPLFQLTRETLLGDFFNKHHFDYRGLIEKGLALEAPEDMYNIKDK